MKHVFILLTATMFFTACGWRRDDYNGANSYEKTKKTLAETEKETPAKFITVAGEKKKNLIGQTVVRGEVTNNAKVVTYKDVDIKLSFYSKTGAVLEEDHETVYEAIAPGATVKFKSKYFTPKGADSVGFKVVEAKY